MWQSQRDTVDVWVSSPHSQILTLWIGSSDRTPTQSVGIWRAVDETHPSTFSLQDFTFWCFKRPSLNQTPRAEPFQLCLTQTTVAFHYCAEGSRTQLLLKREHMVGVLPQVGVDLISGKANVWFPRLQLLFPPAHHLAKNPKNPTFSSFFSTISISNSVGSEPVKQENGAVFSRDICSWHSYRPDNDPAKQPSPDYSFYEVKHGVVLWDGCLSFIM